MCVRAYAFKVTNAVQAVKKQKTTTVFLGKFLDFWTYKEKGMPLLQYVGTMT